MKLLQQILRPSHQQIGRAYLRLLEMEVHQTTYILYELVTRLNERSWAWDASDLPDGYTQRSAGDMLRVVYQCEGLVPISKPKKKRKR